MNTDKPEFSEMPEPVGYTIMKAIQEDQVQFVPTPDGHYFHYSQVCKLLSPLQSKISSLESENQELRERIYSQNRANLNHVLRTQELESDRERLLSLISKTWDAAGEYEYRSHFGKVPTDVPNKEQWFKENGI